MKNLAVFLTLFFWISSAVSSETKVRFSLHQDHLSQKHAYLSSMNHYYLSLLKLALDKTVNTDGPFQFINLGKSMSQSRAFEELYKGNIDIFWTMTSLERESIATPVRIPLLKGMLGYRVFIIRDGEQYRFNHIKRVEDLATLVAGQGTNWPDYDILENNAINVIGGSTYHGLFSMLQRGRFDYFPRGINEPWQEIIIHRDKKLAVEKNILLRYNAPIFFFVNKSQSKLANRIERGLRIALDDGSFNSLIFGHPAIKTFLDKIDISKRVIFSLENSLTPESAALINEELLWYQAGDEKKYSPQN